MDKMELFLERQAISDLLIRYGRALDDRDWSKLETCFLPDAVAVYGEEFPPAEGYKAILETVRFALEKGNAFSVFAQSGKDVPVLGFSLIFLFGSCDESASNDDHRAARHDPIHE